MSNLVVQTNTLAINSHRNLKTVGAKTAVASARLSSGYRINSAADDASGLAISEKMRAQIRGLDMASKNTQDGISLVQTAEGGMQEIDNMLQRIRELTVQSANDTNDYTSADRQKLQAEVDQLTQGIDAMANTVEFNKKKLLDGSLTDAATKGSLLADINVKMQQALGTAGAGSRFVASVGSSAVSALAGLVVSTNGTLGQAYSMANASSAAVTSVISYTITNTVSGSAQTASLTVGIANQTLHNSSGGSAAFAGSIATSDFSSAAAVSEFIGAIDSYVGILQDAKKNGAAGVDNALKALSTMRQATLDIYAGLELHSAQSKSYNSLSKVTGSSLWFQTGANSEQGINVGVGKVTSDILGIGLGGGVSTLKLDKANANEISSQIDIVQNALEYVTSQRAKLGAVQNRLDYTKASLEVSSENLTASESRIRDTDMAKEMMKLTAANVLQQAGVSMLSQANQAPQSVLSLLR